MKTLFVLAGGFGTRLRSVVTNVPKPLAPVLNKPFITYLIEHWIDQGINDFVFLLHYEAIQIEAILKKLSLDSEYSNISFRSIYEDKALGTGGAVLHAIDRLMIKDSFLVANADTWLDSGLSALSKEPPCALVAVKVPNCKRYGALQMEGSLITQFNEKSSSIGQGYVSSGLYHLTPEIFNGLDVESVFSLENTIFPKLVANKKLFAIKVDGNFIDIGIPDDYLRFCNWIEEAKNIEL
jgi:D-glycero-alpha-D-manno-heptose 1-phosphate guanylyltransferase